MVIDSEAKRDSILAIPSDFVISKLTPVVEAISLEQFNKFKATYNTHQEFKQPRSYAEAVSRGINLPNNNSSTTIISKPPVTVVQNTNKQQFVVLSREMVQLLNKASFLTYDEKKPFLDQLAELRKRFT